LTKIESALERSTHPPEQWDVAIVALDSQDLAVKDYVAALTDLFEQQDFRSLAPSVYRLGCYLARTKELTPLVPLEEPPKKYNPKTLRQLDKPAAGTTERLADLGPKIRNLFGTDAKRPNRRCVVIASGGCEAIEADQAKPWKDLAVDAILIVNAKRKPPPPEALKAWTNFCASHRGSLIVLQAAPAPATPLPEQMRFHLRRLVQPLQVTNQAP
jgi:hypothetical protein